MIARVYRVFRTRSICVYERYIDDEAVLNIKSAAAQWPESYLEWMLDQPCIFTKGVVLKLADELASLPYHKSLDDLIFILEAYPLSSHHSAVPEIGILVCLDDNFKINRKNLQRNWAYDHCYIVDRNGRTHWLLKSLPKQARHERDPKQTSPRVQRN